MNGSIKVMLVLNFSYKATGSNTRFVRTSTMVFIVPTGVLCRPLDGLCLDKRLIEAPKKVTD